MAAPGNKDLVLCEKCFAMMPSDAEYCSECGAPLTDAPGVVGSDAEVYPELAKANVLRMRKEFKAAEDICLSILRRFPNNASSNTLLGDIAVEKGELEQAVEWYELALDIVPDSVENQQKLANARAKISEQHKEQVVETLEIPKKNPPYLLIAMVVVMVAAFGIAAVIMTSRNGAQGPDPNNSLVFSGQEDKGENARPAPAQTPTEEPQTYAADAQMAERLCRELQLEPSRVPVLEIGSKDKDVKLSLTLTNGDGEWPLRAKVVRKAFELAHEAPSVELTVLEGERKSTQTITRETYERTLDPAFDILNEAVIVETLFGHKMETAPPADPASPTTDPNNGTITPPLGDDGTSDRSGGADDAGGTGSTGTTSAGGESPPSSGN